MKRDPIERFDARFLRPYSDWIWRALAAALMLWLAFVLADIASAQTPQGAVKPSYVQCPPDMQYDPVKEYHKFRHAFGPKDKPLMCTEMVDTAPDGTRCQVAFICGDAT